MIEEDTGTNTFNFCPGSWPNSYVRCNVHRYQTGTAKRIFRNDVTRVSARLTFLGMNPGLLPIHLLRRSSPRIDQQCKQWCLPMLVASSVTAAGGTSEACKNMPTAGSKPPISDLAQNSEQNLFGEWRHALLKRPNLQREAVPSSDCY